MNKYIPLDKRSKKEQKKYHKQQRIVNGFNTGTRDMKSNKTPNRQERKADTRKAIKEEGV